MDETNKRQPVDHRAAAEALARAFNEAASAMRKFAEAWNRKP